MGKYSRITDYLKNQKTEMVTWSIAEIEHLLGFSLPQSAFKYQQWWENDIHHPQAKAWLEAGYQTVDSGNIITTHVVKLRKKEFLDSQLKRQSKMKPLYVDEKNVGMKKTIILETEEVCGYKFNCVQVLSPNRDREGRIIEYKPQEEYNNVNQLLLLPSGKGTFCEFQIDCEAQAGVYLWVVDDEIIYIGETNNLKRRFNQGYGVIHPRNCFVGGQSTNCKMNKVVLEVYKKEKEIKIYFYRTDNYKQVELECECQ